MKHTKHVLEQQVDAMMIDMAGLTRDATTGELPAFRVSSFPYCPLRNLLFRGRTDSASMSFYTSIGTAVHETFQTWKTRGSFSDKIFACWKCPVCAKIQGPCFKPDRCPCGCTQELLYEEITINYRGLSGHVDMIVEFLPGKFMVLDYKTTDLGGKKVRSRNWRDEYPASRSSIIQISTYSTLLRKLFKLNIVGWCLIYVDRGKAIRGTSDYYKVLRPWNADKHNNMLEWIDLACDNNKTLVKLNTLLENETEYSTEAASLLKELVINRPCIDQESYDNWMSYRFSKWDQKEENGYKNGECLLKESCLKGNKSCMKRVKSLL